MPGGSLLRNLAGAFLLLPLSSAVLVHVRGSASCKSIPGDPGWPKQESWDQLNQTVHGRLVTTIPQAAVCHIGGYGALKEDEAACKALQPDWDFPQT